MIRRKNGEVWGSNPVMEPSITHLDPWAKLGCAVLKRACSEAQAGDLAAAEWLLSDWAGWLADLLEMDSVAMQKTARQWLQNQVY